MRHMIRLSAAAAVLVLGASVPVRAMPLASGPIVPENAVTLIADGCGPFGHRSHYGYCKPNGDGGYARGGDGYDRGGDGVGFRFGGGGGPGLYEDRDYGEPRCVVRETYYGPRRFCR